MHTPSNHPSGGRTRSLSRRAVLGGLLGATGLAACSGSSTGSSSARTTAAEDTTIQFLSPYFPSDFPVTLRSGIDQRMVWGVRDHEGIGLDDLTPATNLLIENADGDVVADVATTVRGTGVPRPYLEVRHTFDEPGFYTAVLPFGDGEPLRRAFVIGSPEDVRLVQVGEWAVPVQTPTVADARGVDPICTRNPACGLHETSLADALQQGEPTALLVSTPGFCQTAICAPTLELLLGMREDFADITMIHAEVYADIVETGDPLSATLTDVVMDYAMDFEPSLVTIDREGMVTERLDFVFDEAEMVDALSTLI